MANQPAYGAPVAASRNNGFAIAGLVCGIVGIFVANIILGPLAIIFGGIGLSRANRGGAGKNMSLAGIILGIVDIVLWIVLLAVLSSKHHFVI